MKRLLMKELIRWQHEKQRKPLILRGVRQTGKTYLLKTFGAECFKSFFYFNFEEQPNLAALFDQDFDVKRILQELSFAAGKTINPKTDFLILDEIQACPNALTSLKYFCENLPALAVCAAGSLLGLHLGETSFPVGKVDLLSMQPLCFAEFLAAVGENQLLSYLETLEEAMPMSLIAHEQLWDQFKRYLVVGGLPEVVNTYVEHQQDLLRAFQAVREKQDQLILGYYADITKHAGKVNAMHIDRVWRAVPTQLAQSSDDAASRFKFKGVLLGVDRYHRLANVFDWLIAAELIIKVPVIDHVMQPLFACVEESKFKLYMFDVGVLGAMLGLPPKVILDYDYGTYKGFYVENFVAQEFKVANQKNLYSWQVNRAEVEFLLSDENAIIPVEVKSGAITRSQSLIKYVEKYKPPYRVILNAKPQHIDLAHGLKQYPIYFAYWVAKKMHR